MRQFIHGVVEGDFPFCQLLLETDPVQTQHARRLATADSPLRIQPTDRFDQQGAVLTRLHLVEHARQLIRQFHGHLRLLESPRSGVARRRGQRHAVRHAHARQRGAQQLRRARHRRFLGKRRRPTPDHRGGPALAVADGGSRHRYVGGFRDLQCGHFHPSWLRDLWRHQRQAPLHLSDDQR